MERRDFIISLSTSILTIATACKKPVHKIVPMVMPDEINQAGKTLYYNTVYPHYGIPYGISVKTREGRPVKIEANPQSPINPNGTNATIQASLFSLYSPTRFRQATVNGKQIELIKAIESVKKKIDNIEGNILILSSDSNSILLRKLIKNIIEENSKVKFYQFPLTREPFIPLSLFYSLSEKEKKKKRIIISLGADILGNSKYSLLFQNKLFDDKRNYDLLLTAEPYLTQTGLFSDKRETRTIGELEMLAALIFNKLYSDDMNFEIPFPVLPQEFDYLLDSDIIKTIDDNKDADFYLFCGEYLSEQSNKIATVINKTEFQSPSAHFNNEVERFSRDLSPNDLIIFLDFNPYYSDKKLAEICNKVPIKNRITLSQYFNETAENCYIHIPESNYLENWNLLSYPNDKNIYFQQPVVQKLNEDSLSKIDFLLNIFGPIEEIANEYDYFRSVVGLNDEKLATVLKTGHIEDSSNLTADLLAENADYTMNSNDYQIAGDELQIIGIQSAYNYANIEPGNPFLLELPAPVTKHCWGNVAMMSRKTAQLNNLQTGDIIQIKSDVEAIELPVLITDGMADNLIISELNYEAQTGEKFLSAGKNISKLFAHERPLTNVMIYKTDKKIKIPTHKGYNNIELNVSIEQLTTDEFLKIKHKKYQTQSKKAVFGKTFEYSDTKWEMEIDLSKCTGCNACTVACQIENNIPVTGDEAVLNDRDMYWLTINTYVYQCKDKIRGEFEPIMCQHCENAPCETVCPVSATTHSPDGINEMTYNSCVGSRYCMVNCPYQIRKFNYENYRNDIKSPLELLLNPDVTVRSRGVSEKCTFCVHRIREYESQKQLQEGVSYVQTACQQVCPTNAISFGNILSKKFKKDKNSYKLLDNLNTLPAVSYLSRFNNYDENTGT